jgi:hypothetical protein
VVEEDANNVGDFETDEEFGDYCGFVERARGGEAEGEVFVCAVERGRGRYEGGIDGVGLSSWNL